jgi:hypothetical protein
MKAKELTLEHLQKRAKREAKSPHDHENKGERGAGIFA